MNAVSYRTLFNHRLKHLWRSGPKRTRILKGLFFGGFIAYIAFALGITGYAFPEILLFLGYSPSAVPLLNEYLFLIALLLLPSRFLLQRSLKLDFRPYLALPIPHRRLVRFAQAAGLTSLFNILPFAFLLPFWWRVVLPVVSPAESLLWLAGCVLLLLVTHFITEGLRLLHLRFRQTFHLITSAFLLAVAGDLGLGLGLINQASHYTFNGLIEGSLAPLVPLIGTVGLFAAGTAALLRIHLRHGAVPTQRRPFSFSPAFFEREAGPTGRLLLLDWTLLLRNKRPRRSLVLALVFSVLNVPILLTPQMGNELVLASLAAGFALILLPSSYGQYLFSWDSEHFDTFLTWPISSRDIIRSRILMLMILAFAIFLIVMPFFYWLAPHYLLLLICFHVYVLGIACPVLLFVGIWNRRRLHLSKGAVLNYEGLSMKQFLVNLPIFIPPLAILLLLPIETALWTLTIVGGVGLASAPLWIRMFTYLLNRRKHKMAVGFRKLDT